MQYVSPKLVAQALSAVEGIPFERFVSDFMAELLGSDFVPLGGLKDGGADGLLSDAKGRFIQTSIREDVSSKIRQTIKRLKEYGRDPRQLIYVSSQVIRTPDKIEDKLGEEFDVTIRIRDAGYIQSHINDSPGTQAAFLNHLQSLTLDLERGSRTALVTSSVHVKDPSVFVFLAQEADDTGASQSLMNAVVDSLILWALEGTDPDQDRLMSEPQVLSKIIEALPSIENLIENRIHKRLTALSSKGGGSKRRVRAHKKEGMYCLPFETRKRLAEDIADDNAVRHQVTLSIRSRIEKHSQSDSVLTSEDISKCVNICLRTLQFSFERQGISVMGALGTALSDVDTPTATDTTDESPDAGVVYLADHLAEALDEANFDGVSRIRLAEVALHALRGVLYSSTGDERAYLRKLSKTYTLLFTLSLDPRLISYFQQMAGNFYLYVGTDQLVRALSEVCLDPADRVVTNTLKMASKAGARLVLTEPVLTEVMHNLRTSDLEYRNTFELVSDQVSYDIVRNSPKILVRAYMYARMDAGGRGAANWPAFVNQYCDYTELHRASAFDSLRLYFQAEYGFEYRSADELKALVDADEHRSLSQSLTSRTEKREVLAENDALIALAVYGHRRKGRETSTISEFGYSTWWLTQESQILRHTNDLVEYNNGTGYVMRPEFLLNFLTLAPSASMARDAFREVFPSLLGVNLSRRLPEKAFRSLLDKITSAKDMPEARRAAKLSQLSDRLKGDFARTYLATRDSHGETTGIDAVQDRKMAGDRID